MSKKYCPLPGCKDIQFDLTERACYRCGTALLGGELEPKADLPDDFTFEPGVVTPFAYKGYDVSWEDYKLASTRTWGLSLKGEWVATAQNGVATVRMPAIVPEFASDLEKTAEKTRSLARLMDLLRDTP